MVTTTNSTQTNKADIYVDTADAGIQVDENSTIEKLNILHDTTYDTYDTCLPNCITTKISEEYLFSKTVWFVLLV